MNGSAKIGEAESIWLSSSLDLIALIDSARVISAISPLSRICHDAVHHRGHLVSDIFRTKNRRKYKQQKSRTHEVEAVPRDQDQVGRRDPKQYQHQPPDDS